MRKIIPFVGRLDNHNTRIWLDLLNDQLDDLTVVPLCKLDIQSRKTARVAIVANPDPTDLADLPNLKWIQSVWAGVERLLSEYPDKNVQIVRMIDPLLSQVMAEAALAWSLFILRDMHLYRQQQAEQLWRQHQLPLPSEKTIGVLGLGALGKTAALRLKDNGFNTIGWSRSPCDITGVKTYFGDCELQTVLALSDILVVLLPLSPQTTNLLDANRISQMKPGVSILNFGRGATIDDDALVKALDSSRIKHAILDVFAIEPLPDGHIFWTHPNVTVLPHISAPTNKISATKIVVANVAEYFRSGRIPNAVNQSMGY